MEKLNDWGQIASETVQSIFKSITEYLPNIIGALLIVILGWLVFKMVTYFIKKLFKILKIDELSSKINKKGLLGNEIKNINITKIFLVFVKFLFFLISIMLAFDALELQSISTEISSLLRYIPQLLASILLFAIGFYIANFIKNALVKLFNSFDLIGGNIIGNIVFYVIITIISVAAINQAGVDTSIISNNLTIIITIIFASFGLAFGLGSKDVIKDLLKTFYARKKYKIGQEINVKNLNGVIETIDTISITLKTKNSRVVVPISDLFCNDVEIID